MVSTRKRKIVLPLDLLLEDGNNDGVGTATQPPSSAPGAGATTAASRKKQKRSPSAAAPGGGAKCRSRLCSVPGCTKQVQQGGVCCRHGARTTRALCSTEGCTNVAKRGGICRKHGAFDLKICAHDGCKRVARWRGAGSTHCDLHHHDGPSKPTMCPPKKHRVYGPSADAKNNASSAPSSGAARTRKVRPAKANSAAKGTSKCPPRVVHRVCGRDSCLAQAAVGCGGLCYPCTANQCSHEGCMSKSVYDGVCVAHGAMRRVYSSPVTVSDASSSSTPALPPPPLSTSSLWSPVAEVDIRSADTALEQGGGDVQLDFLCDYYEDMYDQFT